ncbi:MAG TPA: hypothetical protein PK033_04665 [Acetivibrio sp.]|jgi:hypothetical protein|uniref:hypothetical protein n=1 Tax=Desnuesiella massiliensis TaxID=1650662 RepID=UPI0006E32D89|nr:hypothetical protein [Desnuesiella massiliensis]NLK64007.1 hypothetical protein [Tissierellia bacterium]HQA57151.1 hypothetical protein [Acetivibrio sp.]
MIAKLKLNYLAFLINLHWVFIRIGRKKIDRLLNDGEGLSSRKLFKADKPLNYHCTRVLILEEKYKYLARESELKYRNKRIEEFKLKWW